MTHSPATAPPGHLPPHVVRSWIAAAVSPVAIVVGFVVGSALIGDLGSASAPSGWDATWRVLVVWVLVALPSVLGVLWAVEARRRHERDARTPLAVNALMLVFLTAATLGGGLIDALG